MKDTMIQYFEWYVSNTPSLYEVLKKEAAHLEKLGFTRIWMPPAYKGQGGKDDVGYGVYDMYDLGEFNQKGSVRTKYGTKKQYLEAINACHKHNLDVIADIVFNHRMGADEEETVMAKEMNWDNRNEAISDEEEVVVWTKYTFPGRKGKYSDFTWDWTCFDGTDYDDKRKEKVLLTFDSKTWDENVSQEEGNYDFIMGDDLDFDNQKVVDELYRWGKWYKEMTNVDGYRLDAVKSISSFFFEGWLQSQQALQDKPIYAVGEYWSGDLSSLEKYLEDCNHSMHLFDVPFHFNLMNASSDYNAYDMRTIFDNTLVTAQNEYACAFVDNHDTQPGQALESWVQNWFKLHAYSLILLRNFISPCVFYGDLYGIQHDSIGPVAHLDELVWIRSHILGDDIEDKFDDPNCVGWMVKNEHPVIVVMTNKTANFKEFNLEGYANTTFVDITSDQKVVIDENCFGKFSCFDGSCSIFIEEEVYKEMKEELNNESCDRM